MTHKTVRLPKKYHYTRSEVPFERTISQIKDLLSMHGCEKFGMMEERGRSLYTLVFQKAGLSYIIEFPITFKTQASEPDMRVSGRIVLDRLKAMLIEVEIGYLDFAQAMMPYIAVCGPEGKPVSLQDHIDSQRQQLQQGRFDLGYLLSVRRDPDRDLCTGPGEAACNHDAGGLA